MQKGSSSALERMDKLCPPVLFYVVGVVEHGIAASLQEFSRTPIFKVKVTQCAVNISLYISHDHV